MNYSQPVVLTIIYCQRYGEHRDLHRALRRGERIVARRISQGAPQSAGTSPQDSTRGSDNHLTEVASIGITNGFMEASANYYCVAGAKTRQRSKDGGTDNFWSFLVSFVIYFIVQRKRVFGGYNCASTPEHFRGWS
jgi:hypothetical protein